MKTRPPQSKDRRWQIALALAALVIAGYWRVVTASFVTYDDDVYVTNNLRVQSGLTLENIGWAFTATEAANWHPLTWISHELDCQLFGLDAPAHHVTSALIHLSNVILLFLVLNLMTGALWRSALVAAIFAVHPINVESVTWIAERKNVLSSFFLLLTVWAYVWYARKPGWRRYLLVAVMFAMGLMSKPMLV